MGELLTLDAAAALLTLTVLELVLGVDNVVLIAIVTDRLDRRRQRLARRLGLLAAMVMRIALLLGAAWLMGLTSPLLTLLGREVSAKDLVLLAGGAFLIFKATQELHSMLEGPSREEKAPRAASVGLAVAQIALFDVVFSIDSVLTAVGMTRHVPIMVVAI
ncbi:MAG: TerC family protein, partial [Planctomycetota bacterium]